jgi:hypothetical protein
MSIMQEPDIRILQRLRKKGLSSFTGERPFLCLLLQSMPLPPILTFKGQTSYLLFSAHIE